MEGSIIYTDYNFIPNQLLPSVETWDNVSKYNNYYISISCQSNCLISVYQSNDTLFPEDEMTTDTFNYSTTYPRMTIFKSGISCLNISFSIKNLSTTPNPSLLNFSVLYK